MPVLRRHGGRWVMSSPPSAMLPPLGSTKPGDHAQRRRLAAAGRAEQDEELAILDVQRDVLHRDVAP